MLKVNAFVSNFNKVVVQSAARHVAVRVDFAAVNPGQGAAS